MHIEAIAPAYLRRDIMNEASRQTVACFFSRRDILIRALEYEIREHGMTDSVEAREWLIFDQACRLGWAESPSAYRQ